MKSTNITFSQIAEKRYLSDPIQVNSETIGLQIDLKESGKMAVYISYDGERYSVVETRNITTLPFARPVVGLIPGQYIKIECETEPVKAQYFESEE